jgi:DNA-binding NtrC family response regulator
MLVEHFLRKFGEENNRKDLHFTPEALRLMVDYNWPGNVRELENAVERAVVLSAAPDLGPDLLPEQISSNGSNPAQPLPLEDFEGRSLFDIIGSYERRVILEMLARTNWSQTEAAEKFKIPLSTLNQKIKRLQIDIKRHRDN